MDRTAHVPSPTYWLVFARLQQRCCTDDPEEATVGLRRRGVAVAMALLLAACSGSPDDEVPEGAADAGSEAATSEVESEPEDEEPTGSSLTVTGEHERSDVEIRIAELLTELEATDEPEGAVVEIEDTVLFEFDSADLRPEAAGVLDELVELLELLEAEPAEIRGHTDDVGEDDYNLELSRDRAESVAAYLVDAGIDQDRLTVEGLGSSEPVADNTNPDGTDNPEGRARNRRVEVVLPTVEMSELPAG
jgi:outer membrane protein OmpA-like peptidoglycan-associated protein